MSDKIKEILETPIIPDELKPENIPELLEKRGAKGSADNETETDGVLRDESIKTLNGSKKSGKKKTIRTFGSYFAAAAACLVIVTGAVKIATFKSGREMMTSDAPVSNGIRYDAKEKTVGKSDNAAAASDNAESYEAESDDVSSDGKFAYLRAESYEQLFERAKNVNITRYGFEYDEEAEAVNAEEDSSLDDGQYKGAEAGTDVYDTLSQVEGVAESDIIKANDRGVFYVTSKTPVYSNSYFGECVTFVSVDKETGKFGEKTVLDIEADAGLPENVWSDVSAMYLTDDRLIVLASAGDLRAQENERPATTTVLTYDITGEKPVLAGKGVQSGTCSSSRMKGDILYLVTDQSSWNFFTDYNYYDEDEGRMKIDGEARTYADTDKRIYVPFYGESYEKAECLSLDRIFIPETDDEDGITMMISGIDINAPENAISSAAVSGYSGEIYCTADALYIQQVNYDSETLWYDSQTTFSKFALADGVISPVASGTVRGTVLNQFSMDEYNGYFRAATTSYEETDNDLIPSNNVFVLDPDMNVVGSITNIAPKETIKSVNFQGDTAYVVTYERTDPLFAIDLSDPAAPVITDEFKINGYSSFLWKWDEDHLVGFGVDATEEGIETGVKLVMFDVSDNGELKEDGFYAISAGDTYHSSYSLAVYDRKALLLDPEKNLIGFPLEEYDRDYYKFEQSYLVFSYEDGEFVEKAIIDSQSTYSNFDRGVYIGDHLYVFSHDEAVSLDLETMTETDRTEFDTIDNRKKNENNKTAAEDYSGINE